MKKEFLQDNLRVFVVPVEIMDVPDLDIYEQMVYMVLRSFASARTATAFPSYATIAKLGRMSRRKAITTVQSLVDKGLLKKDIRLDVSKNRKVKNTSNLYTIENPTLVHDMHHPSAHCAPPPVHDMHHPSAHCAPEHNHLTKPIRTDDELLKEEKEEGQVLSSSTIEEENKKIIEQFKEYGVERGIHKDYVHEIAKNLSSLDSPLSRHVIGIVVNKTLEVLKSGSVSHIPNYFMAVLNNEINYDSLQTK